MGDQIEAKNREQNSGRTFDVGVDHLGAGLAGKVFFVKTGPGPAGQVFGRLAERQRRVQVRFGQVFAKRQQATIAHPGVALKTNETRIENSAKTARVLFQRNCT